MKVWLPVKMTLLQNCNSSSIMCSTVWLPVKMTLLQNFSSKHSVALWFDYQSKWHCSKTDSVSISTLFRLITSQNDTAPKLKSTSSDSPCGLITSQNDTAPKRTLAAIASLAVWLPVKMTLLQNSSAKTRSLRKFDYQSKWHCSKTWYIDPKSGIEFDYQSKWHCSKTCKWLGRCRC